MRLTLLALTLTSWLPRPVDVVAPIQPRTCFVIYSDILTANSDKPLIKRWFMPCWRCHKYYFCVDTTKGQP